MKKIIKHISTLGVVASVLAVGCAKQEESFISGTVSPFISNFDLKKTFKETDLKLTKEVMKGASSIKGIVISDAVSGNAPKNLLVIQNTRIVGNGIDSIRGVSINLGADASKYLMGDSLHINVEGTTLKRINGILQIEGVSNSSIAKMGSGKKPKVQVANIAQILANPGQFESSLVAINNSAFDPEPATGATYVGDKIINDGFGVATLHTEATANFANIALQPSGNFTGIPFISGTGAEKKITYWMRSATDFFYVPMPKLSPAIISGYLVDPNGSDGNYEYVQLLATKDINFATNPMSVITTNNAGTGVFPVNGWATGGTKTYKFNIKTGTVQKGQYFYVGGTGFKINGSASTSIPAAKFYGSVDYTATVGADGVGVITANLLANSGNPAGVAVFEGTTVTSSSVPLDVIFFGGNNGSYYTTTPTEVGYRITITDQYSTYAGIIPQEYFGKGTNTKRFAFPTATSFARLGGVYKATKGGWDALRTLTSVPLTNSSVLTDIETGGTTLIDK